MFKKIVVIVSRAFGFCFLPCSFVEVFGDNVFGCVAWLRSFLVPEGSPLGQVRIVVYSWRDAFPRFFHKGAAEPYKPG